MFNRILVICTGNICRSPMAEKLLADRYPARDITSAGIGALVDKPADAMAIELMAERQLDISAHRARQVDREMLTQAELVLVMESHQARWLHENFPHVRGRVQEIGRWSDTQVIDPFRKPRQVFEESLAQIDQCIEEWVTRL